MAATGHVFIATSLDGFIAKPDGDIAWLIERDAPNEDHGYDSFIEKIDAILMGRATFEKVASMEKWPFTKPVTVLSKTLNPLFLPDSLQEKVKICSLSPTESMRESDRAGVKRFYNDGQQVIQSFLNEGLIEDIVITVVPILLGQGRSLFGVRPLEHSLIHLKTISFPSGLVQSHYSVCKS